MASFPQDSLGWCLHCGAGHDTALCPRTQTMKDGDVGRKTADGRVKALKDATSVEVSRFDSGVAFLENHQSQVIKDADPVSRFEKVASSSSPP